MTQTFEQPIRPKTRPPYLILIAMSTVAPMAMNMFVPSMPGLQTVFGVSSGSVQLTLTVYIAALALCQFVYGPLSDRFGRRPVLLVGLAIFVVASAGCALAPTIEWLITARAFQAIGGASGMILARTIVRDLFDRDEAASVLGYITMAWVLAPMAAPFIGGVLDQAFSYRASFVALAVLGGMVLVATWMTLPETNANTRSDGRLVQRAVYARLLANRAYLGYAATLAFSSAVFFCYLAMAPFVIITMRGHSPIDYGLWAILPALGYMSGNFLSGRYSMSRGVDRMIGLGNTITMAGAALLLALAVADVVHPAALFAPMAICTLGNGLTIPNGISAAISCDPKNIGSAAGLAGGLQMTAAALVSQAVGEFQGTWPVIGFWVIFASALLASIAFRGTRAVTEHPARSN